MREDLLQELETEYERTRAANEREEETRKERIRSGYPEIHELLKARENLVFGTLRAILDRNAKATDLSDRMEEINGQIREKLTAPDFPPIILHRYTAARSAKTADGSEKTSGRNANASGKRTGRN